MSPQTDDPTDERADDPTDDPTDERARRAGDLEGKVAVVTGGASGIGAATVRLLSARGAAVVIADVDARSGEALAVEVDAAGGTAWSMVVDVTDPEQVEALVAAAVDGFGGLDIAVNNAGTSGSYSSLTEHSLAEWDRTLAVNLTGVFVCLRAEVPALLARGGGVIVNTASDAGLMGFAGLPAYVASKHGVVGLTKSVALEYARKGIRVNAVCPGSVNTPMLEGFVGGDQAALEGMGKVTPMGRLGTPDEVAEAIVWLCSDASSYVTGAVVTVDGGVMAT